MTTDNLIIDRDTIIAAKRGQLQERQARTPIDAIRALASMQKRPMPILNTVTDGSHITLLGEVQYHSGYANSAAESYDPVGLAQRFIRAGVDAISLFTDKDIYPRDIDDLALLTRAVSAPVLTRNYILNEYHVVEMRAAGASALVLSSNVLDRGSLRNLVSATVRNRMTAIVEVSTPDEVDYALSISPHAIALGCASEDEPLDHARFLEMRSLIPSHIRILATVNLETPADVQTVVSAGVNALLVDEHLFSRSALGKALRALLPSAAS